MDHTKELIENAHKGDKKAREQLVLENMGLIGSIVKRFAGRGCEQEDLFQIGSIGLIKAVDKFDTSYDVRFSTYAVPMITGEIKRFLRDDGMIKVSRSLKENAIKTARAVDEYRKEHLKEPTVEIVSRMTGSEVQLIDRLPENRNVHDEVVNTMVIHELIDGLSENEKKIIKMRYFEERTQTDIAVELGISQVQVSRLEKRILAAMREKIS